MKKALILVLGGARAGKSTFAQQLAQQLGENVLFVATAQPGDAEMAERIRHHRTTRPKEWHTLEEPLHLAEAVARVVESYQIVLIDCLTLWVSNLLLQQKDGDEHAHEKEIVEQTGSLLDCYECSKATFILVSNEVGMGVVPPYPLGRQFRDILGKVNQIGAARADKVYLLVAGLPMELKSLAAQPTTSPKHQEG
jgi:adenosylcobinamide kinase/adenosylcobinamide-phosphate guanylyltransferase